MLDLSKIELNEKTAEIFKMIGIKLYFNYDDKKLYVSNNYWSQLPESAKAGLILIKELEKEKEINDGNK
jgi:hypothetical protein